MQLQSSDRLNVILGYIGVSKNDAIINSCAPGAGQPGGQGTFQAAARLPKNQKAKRAVISTDTMSQPTSQPAPQWATEWDPGMGREWAMGIEWATAIEPTEMGANERK